MLRLLATLAVIGTILVSGPAAFQDNQAATSRLLSANALRCEFPEGVQTDWDDGEPSTEPSSWRNSTQVFRSIDRQQRTAVLVGNSGATASVAFLATPLGQLTFLEVPLLGAPNMTTVFPFNLPGNAEQFVVVTSRHVDTGSPFPSQFYGTCVVME